MCVSVCLYICIDMYVCVFALRTYVPVYACMTITHFWKMNFFQIFLPSSILSIILQRTSTREWQRKEGEGEGEEKGEGGGGGEGEGECTTSCYITHITYR